MPEKFIPILIESNNIYLAIFQSNLVFLYCVFKEVPKRRTAGRGEVLASHHAPAASYRASPSAATKLHVLFTFSLNTRRFVQLHELNFRVQLLKVLANIFVSFFIALSAFFLQNRTLCQSVVFPIRALV